MAKAVKPKKEKATSGTISQGTDKMGRDVRHFTEDGKHYVEANRNGATHPVECASEAEAKKLYKQECEVE